MNNPSQHPLAHMSWGILIFFYVCWWPLGLVLTILKIVDQKAEERENADRQAWINAMNGAAPYAAGANGQAGQQAAPYRYTPQTGAAAAQTGHTAPPPHYAAPASAKDQKRKTGAPQYQASPDQATAEQKKALKNHQTVKTILFVLFIIMLFTGLPQLVEGVSMLTYGSLYSWVFTDYILPGLAKLLGGAAVAFCGARMARGLRREKLLATIVGTRDSVPLRELSAASGYGEKKTLQLLKDAVGHGLFGAKAYIDMRTQTLVVRGAPPAPVDAPAPAPQQKQPAAQKDEDKYQKILRQLREVNDAIPGEEMSAKISRMEQTSARIFALAQKDPKKVPQLNRFMDYYLPTALKLLNTYATLEQQGAAGQNIAETKASIENAMDLLVKAFDAQLDKLFQSDALDVSGDIAALQGMLSMDGLVGNNDFATAPQTPTADPPQ